MATKSKSKSIRAKKSPAKSKASKAKKIAKRRTTAKGSSAVVSLGKLGRIGDG